MNECFARNQDYDYIGQLNNLELVLENDDDPPPPEQPPSDADSNDQAFNEIDSNANQPMQQNTIHSGKTGQEGKAAENDTIIDSTSIPGRKGDTEVIQRKSIELCKKLIRVDDAAGKNGKSNSLFSQLATLRGLANAASVHDENALDMLIGGGEELVRSAKIANLAIENAQQSKAEKMLHLHYLAVVVANRAYMHRKKSKGERRDPLCQVIEFKDDEKSTTSNKLRNLTAIANYAHCSQGLSILLMLPSLSAFKTHGTILNRQVEFWKMMCLDRRNILPTADCEITVKILEKLFPSGWRNRIYLHPPLYELFDETMSDLLSGTKRVMDCLNLSSMHMPATGDGYVIRNNLINIAMLYVSFVYQINNYPSCTLGVC